MNRDLDPETLAEWRKDAEWKVRSFPYTKDGHYARQILRLLDALDQAHEDACSVS